MVDRLHNFFHLCLSDSLSLHSPIHSQLKIPSPTPSISPQQQGSKTIPQNTLPALPKPSHNSKMAPRPKPLRPLIKDLHNITCVSGQALFKHITKDDAPKDPPDDSPPTLQQAMSTILNCKEGFCITMDSKFKTILTDLLSKPEKKAKDLFKLNSE